MPDSGAGVNAPIIKKAIHSHNTTKSGFVK
jgi:hypothetical protein